MRRASFLLLIIADITVAVLFLLLFVYSLMWVASLSEKEDEIALAYFAAREKKKAAEKAKDNSKN